MIPKVQQQKKKKKLDFIKIKNSDTSIDSNNKLERKPLPTEWEKLGKHLLFRVYKEFLQLNNNKKRPFHL